MLATPKAPRMPALPDMPRIKSTTDENMSAQIVIPEIGLLDEPTNPQI